MVGTCLARREDGMPKLRENVLSQVAQDAETVRDWLPQRSSRECCPDCDSIASAHEALTRLVELAEHAVREET